MQTNSWLVEKALDFTFTIDLPAKHLTAITPRQVRGLLVSNQKVLTYLSSTQMDDELIAAA